MTTDGGGSSKYVDLDWCNSLTLSRNFMTPFDESWLSEEQLPKGLAATYPCTRKGSMKAAQHDGHMSTIINKGPVLYMSM